MRVLVICGEPGSPGHHYRVLNLVKALTTIGVESSWMTIDAGAARVDEVAKANMVFLWRTAWDESVAAIAGAARKSGSVIVFDADDLVIEPGIARCSIIDGIRTLRLSEKEVERYYARTAMSFEAADWACCSTDELAAVMRRRGKPTIVLRNGYDDVDHRASRLAVQRCHTIASDGLLRIGYAAGTRSHQRDFAAAAEPIAALLRERRDVQLVLFRHVSDGRPLVDPDEFSAFHDVRDRIEWRNFVPLNDLPDEMARFDINIAPIEVGNPFCEAKSELKFVQAALVDVCTVASPTGPFRRAIQHEKTGFLAPDTRSWDSILRRLLDDRSLRRRIGEAAYLESCRIFGPRQRELNVTAMIELITGSDSRRVSDDQAAKKDE